MTKEQFIEKWYNRTGLAHPAQREVFESDLNSLFNLRTETRTREEVRDRLDESEAELYDIYQIDPTDNGLRQQLLQDKLNVTNRISLLKWFLKE